MDEPGYKPSLQGRKHADPRRSTPLIVVDAALPRVEEAFSGLGKLRLVRTSEIVPRTVADADLLVIRTETPVNSVLLEESQVRFVGSASTGFDHVDQSYLQERGIAFAHAAGCNADAVAQHTVAALLWMARTRGVPAANTTIGVVGVGQIGSRVVRLARALGLEVLENDPPRARIEPGPRWSALNDLADCDLISLHVPLTQSGPDRTRHLFDSRRISGLGGRCWLLNTSRGAVVDNQALKKAFREGKLAGAMLDVWENEPAIDFELVDLVGLATAHVAARTLEGWIRATEMIYQAACRFLGASPEWSGLNQLPQAHRVIASQGNPARVAQGVVRACHDIGSDDLALRALKRLSPRHRVSGFQELRNRLPQRREWSFTPVSVPAASPDVKELLEKLDFRVIHTPLNPDEKGRSL